MKLTAESTVINDDKLNTNIDSAQTTADEAKQIADNTNQYFWFTSNGDDTGAHISETPQSTFKANPSGGNLLARSNGIAVRDGMTELATFGASGATIGVDTGAHTVIDEDGMQIYSVDSQSNLIQLANIGYGLGKSQSGTSVAPYYTFGTRKSGSTVGNKSVAEGHDITSNGFVSHAEGYDTTASGSSSHAEGTRTTASHSCAHAEGNETTAAGAYSHAGGWGTIANGVAQTVIGKYNVADTTSLFIIGKGNSESRSNAFKVDGDGYIYPQNTQMTDFVVDQGTSGIWSYRKWNSGFAECWGTYTASIAITTAAAAYGGYRSAQITAPDFPFAFASAPTITATSANGGGHWVNNITSSIINVKFYLSIGASSAAANRSISFHVNGKWK